MQRRMMGWTRMFKSPTSIDCLLLVWGWWISCTSGRHIFRNRIVRVVGFRISVKTPTILQRLAWISLFWYILRGWPFDFLVFTNEYLLLSFLIFLAVNILFLYGFVRILSCDISINTFSCLYNRTWCSVDLGIWDLFLLCVKLFYSFIYQFSVFFKVEFNIVADGRMNYFVGYGLFSWLMERR